MDAGASLLITPRAWCHLSSNFNRMENTSKKFQLNKTDLQKIATGALVAVGGALLTYLTQVVAQIDFGDFTPVAVALSSILVNVARKFIADYSASN